MWRWFVSIVAWIVAALPVAAAPTIASQSVELIRNAITNPPTSAKMEKRLNKSYRRLSEPGVLNRVATMEDLLMLEMVGLTTYRRHGMNPDRIRNPEAVAALERLRVFKKRQEWAEQAKRARGSLRPLPTRGVPAQALPLTPGVRNGLPLANRPKPPPPPLPPGF